MLKGIDRKVALSGMLGNGLEWYDYALYGHMSLTFAKLFFPMADQSRSLIFTFLTFAAGFLARPLGAVLFGKLGDSFGRKKALVASMILMAIPTCGIGLLPTYSQIGIAAPLLLLSIRILQGLSLGGAFSGSMSYVVEHAPQDRRATAGSLTIFSLVIGFLVGSMVSSGVASSMSDASFQSWGWRVPFIVGVLIGFVGYWIRNHGEESPVYLSARDAGNISEHPVKEAVIGQWPRMVQGFAIYMFVTVPFYLTAIYLIAYSKAHLGLTQPEALRINSLAMLGMLIPLLPAAILADRIGRKKVLVGALIAVLILIYPLFRTMQDGVFLHVAIAQFILAFVLAWYLSPIPAILVELFPTRVRYTGMALSYNFCAILGGLAPSMAESLIRETGSNISIIYLFIGSAAISLAALVTYKDKWREPLT
ncbi:MAG: MFS transporter, partial [Alphaproteobacteria bacterium]